MVGIGVGGGSRRSGEEEAGGIGRRQHHPLVAARLVTGSLSRSLLTRPAL